MSLLLRLKRIVSGFLALTMPTHFNAYKWLSSIAWEAFNGRYKTATCLFVCICFFVVVFFNSQLAQACIAESVNILLFKFLVIV